MTVDGICWEKEQPFIQGPYVVVMVRFKASAVPAFHRACILKDGQRPFNG